MNYYQEFYPLNPIEKITDTKKSPEISSCNCNCKKHHESNTVLLIIILIVLLIRSFK